MTKVIAINKVAAVLSLIMAEFAVPGQAGTVYNINFTAITGTAPTSGSFTYDSGSGFSAFHVIWGGLDFDLTASANSPHLTSWDICTPAAGASIGFALMTQTIAGCPVDPSAYFWQARADVPALSAVFGFAFDRAPTVPADPDNREAAELFTFTDPNGFTGDPGGAFNVGTFDVEPAPEPTTIGLILLGCLALARKSIARRAQCGTRPTQQA
jgi:hypothetical protein